MPYRSEKQRKFMHVRHPEIAKRWDKEYPNQKNLPEKKETPRQAAIKRRLGRSS